MTPREIDALVAEHCMHFDGCSNCGSKEDCGCDIVDIGSGLPRYSTDPVASKQLRDKMRSDGWIASMEDVRLLLDGTFVVKARFRKFGHTESHDAISDTEEMPFALAALAAKGHPVSLEQGAGQRAAAGKESDGVSEGVK